MADFESEMKAMMGDLKDWEKASRPAPAPEREANVAGKFCGIITLADQGVATELSRVIESVIAESVEIFDTPARIKRLQLDVQRMVALASTFPPWCIDEQLRNNAQREIDQLRSSEAELNRLLARHEPGTMLKGDLGKAVAKELKGLLARMVQLAVLMEMQQYKLVMLACDKARQIIAIVGRTNHDHNIDEKYRLLRLHTDALYQLCSQRLAVLERLGFKDESLKDSLQRAMDRLRTHCESLIEATNARVQRKDQSGQDHEKGVLLDTLAEIERVAQAMAPKMYSDFDHDEKILAQLAALRHAVEQNDPSSVASAGKKMMEELEKMKATAHDPVKDKEDDGSARRALEDAAERLKRLLPGLLGKARDAIVAPDIEHKQAFEAVVDDYQKNVKVAVPSRPQRDFDEVETVLAKSGLIGAAADAAKQLESLFL